MISLFYLIYINILHKPHLSTPDVSRAYTIDCFHHCFPKNSNNNAIIKQFPIIYECSVWKSLYCITCSIHSYYVDAGTPRLVVVDDDEVLSG